MTGADPTETLLLQGDAIQGALAPVPMDHVVRHVMHALETCGPDHVAIGSEFDGIDRRPAGLEDASGYQRVMAALGEEGLARTSLGRSLLRILRGP